MWRDVNEKDKELFNSVVTHPLQSYEWGEFRKRTNIKVIRRAFFEKEKITQGFTLTLHNVPKTKFLIGYLPKGVMPDQNLITELTRIGRENNCIFIQLEPNIISDKNSDSLIKRVKLRQSYHPLFTKYTFILDLSKPEDELLKGFHHKTRYNIKIALKRKVKVDIDNSDKAFKEYILLTEETTKRQKFYAHTPSYHKKMWETLRSEDSGPNTLNLNSNILSAHLLKATYKPEGGGGETLASWILFSFHDYLYYPYGASSSKFRNVMASNLIMWEAILFGKKMGLKYFDMWGALSENPNPTDSWHGFHKFKEGYGATHTEFLGSYDLVINPFMYRFYKIADRLRWLFLRIKKSF